MCVHDEGGEVTNKHLCVPHDYNKFDLPYPNRVNPIDIGIDITDVLRINDKVVTVTNIILYKITITNSNSNSQ